MKGADSTPVKGDGKRVKMALHALHPAPLAFAAYLPLPPGAGSVWYAVFQLQAAMQQSIRGVYELYSKANKYGESPQRL